MNYPQHIKNLNRQFFSCKKKLFFKEEDFFFGFFQKFAENNIGTREIKIYPQGGDILKIYPEGEDIMDLYHHGDIYFVTL